MSPPPTATPTPAPTLAPETVSAAVAAGQTQVAAAGVSPLCLRQDDADGDGELEWLGVYLQPAEPPRLLGFVLDGAAWHDLRPPEGEDAERGLGEYPTCELDVRDLNVDGRTELAVWGHAGSSTDYLHIFAWDGTHYALLGAFDGPGGVRLENTDGDLADEVVVRWRPEGTLVWEVVYTWDGTHYAWTWDRYAWYGLERPHALVDDSPVHVVASFYLALNDRDLPGAYGLLSAPVESYSDWAWNFNTTMAVEVGAVHVAAQDGPRATVAAQVRALDNVDGRLIVTLYEAEWQVVEAGTAPDGRSIWRLESGTAERLQEWELGYYP